MRGERGQPRSCGCCIKANGGGGYKGCMGGTLGLPRMPWDAQGCTGLYWDAPGWWRGVAVGGIGKPRLPLGYIGVALGVPWGCPGGAGPLLPDRLKLDSCRSLMPPWRVAGRVGVSARGVPVSFFPAWTTAATSPRYGLRSTALGFKLCREMGLEGEKHRAGMGGGAVS